MFECFRFFERSAKISFSQFLKKKISEFFVLEPGIVEWMKNRLGKNWWRFFVWKLLKAAGRKLTVMIWKFEEILTVFWVLNVVLDGKTFKVQKLIMKLSFYNNHWSTINKIKFISQKQTNFNFKIWFFLQKIRICKFVFNFLN